MAFLGIFLMNGCKEQKLVENQVVSPEKQEVVKEGYSGSNKPVVVSHKEFTGGGNKIKVVSPEKPIILKEGFSKPYGANASGNAISTPTPMLVPDTKAKKKVISIIDTTLEELKAVEADIKKEMK